MDFTRQIEVNRRALLDDIDRRIEAALRPFARDLDWFLATLFLGRLPPDWRQRWQAFVAEQANRGFTVEPYSVLELEEWIEDWASFCGLLPVAEPQVTESREVNDDAPYAADEPIQHYVPPVAALVPQSDTPEKSLPGPNKPPIAKPATGTQRGDQSRFATEAEEIVSEATGVPRNTPGPGQQTIPGSGPGGFRIPDLKVRGPEGSVRLRGTIVEIKASTGTKFGDLSGLSRQQIEDAVEYVSKLQSKASLVKDPALKALLENAHVEVFSDLPKPKSGRFARFIEDKLLDWKPIPRPESVTVRAGSHPVAVGSPRSIGKPGLGAAENIALGVVISLVEAGIANTLYRESAAVLNDLLQQIAKNGDADENEWRSIEKKLKDIVNMKQSILGYAWEVISYGQGSLQEKQAMAMMTLASELGEKYGYANKKTWGELLTGGQGHFDKKK